MGCVHCEDLREQVLFLESELGFARAKELRVSLRTKLGLTTAEAAVLARLYGANGRLVDHFALVEALPTENDDRSSNIIKVYVSRIRSKIGKAAIWNIYSEGYGLTAEGLQTIAAVL